MNNAYQQLALVGGGRFATSNLDPYGSCEDWAQSSGLDWDIQESPVMFNTREGILTSPEDKVLYRSDNLDRLGVVGEGFTVVQPIEMLKFYRDVCDLQHFKMESLGMIKGGKKMWGLARTSFETRVLGQDKIDAFLFFVTANDGSLSTRVNFISRRLVCNNMLDAAIKGNSNMGWHIKLKHTSKVNFDVMYDKMARLPTYWEDFEQNANSMATKQINQEQMIAYFVSLYGKHAETQKEMVEKKVDQLIQLAYSSPGAELRSARGTLWGALSAVTYYTDHACRARSNENRFASAMIGPGENLKATAYNNALQLLAS